MRKKMIFGILALVSLVSFVTNYADADEMSGGTVNHFIMPAGNEQTAVVVVGFNITSDNALNVNCDSGRLKFLKSDKQMLAILMLAYSLNKTVAFFYNPNSTLGSIPGHGTGTCELINVWTTE